MKKTTKSLIIGIASVVVLVGAFLAVYYLVPDAEEDKDTASTVSGEEGEADDHYHLVSLTSADIKQIDVENEGGKYTLLAELPENAETESISLSDENIYTLVGYEDMELYDGNPQMLAEDAVSVTASKIVDDGSKKSEFGLDTPRAVVTVTTKSGDKRTITLGDDSPAGNGAYIAVDGDENIYLADSDSIDGFLLTEMKMLSVDIGTSLSEDNETKFTKLVLSGTAFNGEEIAFGYNDSEGFTETYILTSPDKTAANEEIAEFVVSNVRYLAANEVAAVGADEKQLKEYGLDEPYMTVDAEYPDMKVSFKASKPEGGEFYLLSGDIVYLMDEAAVPWISYTYEDLLPTEILAPKYDSVDKITVETDRKEYVVFDVTRTSQTVRDDNEDTDIETFTVDVKMNGSELSEDKFSSFYNDLTSAKRIGVNDVPEGGKTLLKVTYEFSDGTSATAEYFEGENRKCPVLINGTLGSTAYESYVKKIYEDLDALD